MKWVRWAAESVTAYYGRFPVPQLLLRIVPSDGKGVRSGRTFGRDNGGFITIHVGKDAQFSDLARDWMLTHEMVHLSFPSVAENHHWIEEGIATYVEPIARVRAGHFDANQMWFEVMRDLHQGLPAAGDEGLDHTHTWGRTYWGGALFCFLADIEIHRETGNKKGTGRRSARNPERGRRHSLRLGAGKSAHPWRSSHGRARATKSLRQNERSAVRRRSSRALDAAGNRTRRQRREIPRYRAASQNPRGDHLRLSRPFAEARS